MSGDAVKVPLSRMQTAPKNVAAKSLRAGQFQPKVEPDPKGYKRKTKHPKPIVVEEAEKDE